MINRYDIMMAAFLLGPSVLNSLSRVPIRSQPWALAKNSVSFQFSCHAQCATHMDEWSKRAHNLLTKASFCFSEIMIIIDPPHGGKDYGPTYLPGPYAGGAQMFAKSEDGARLLRHADHVALILQKSVMNHCPHNHSVTASVHLIDYDDPAARVLLELAFDTRSPPGVPDSAWGVDNPPDAVGNFIFARLWKNSFMYMYSINASKSQYIMHSDNDLPDLVRRKESSNNNFVVNAVNSLQNHPNVVFVNAPKCTEFKYNGKFWTTDNCDNGGCTNIGHSLTAVWRKGGNAPGPYTSTQFFVADVAKVKSRVWPIPWWTDMIEVILTKRLGESGLIYAYLNKEKSHVCRP